MKEIGETIVVGMLVFAIFNGERLIEYLRRLTDQRHERKLMELNKHERPNG